MGFPIVIENLLHFGDSWLDPLLLMSSLLVYHSLRLGAFQTFYTLLTSLNARTSRGLGRFQFTNLTKRARVTTCSSALDDRTSIRDMPHVKQRPYCTLAENAELKTSVVATYELALYELS
jgi:hypothetical protein